MFAELRGMPGTVRPQRALRLGARQAGAVQPTQRGWPWFTLRTFKKYVTRKSSREGGIKEDPEHSGVFIPNGLRSTSGEALRPSSDRRRIRPLR